MDPPADWMAPLMTLRAILVALIIGAAPLAAHADPNVLLIIADDMGIDASRCYSLGNQQAPMPNVEAMCASGMVFDNAYAAPLCSPTRATIITGQYGFRTGVGTAIRRRGQAKGLSADVTSLFDVLAATGYKANLIGKWHLAGAGTTLNHPAELGVPDYFGLIRGGTRDYWRWKAVENGEEVVMNEYATTVFTDRAIDWIRAQDGPWFLWLAYNAPHAPFHLPPAHLHGFDDLPDDPDAIRANPLPYYQAALQALDTEIGRLLAAMPRDVRDNTVVMFIGDNGSPNQVTRGFYGEHAAKGTIFEGGTHVPFVVSGPGIDPGRTESFVNTTDLFATVAGYAEAEVQTADSHDIRPILSGHQGSREYVYVEHFSDRRPRRRGRRGVFGWALRQGPFKLVQVEGWGPMLYDLSKDPLEAVDLLADGTSPDEATIVASIEAQFTRIREE